MTVIGTVGPFYEGSDYEEGWQFATKMGIQMVDEHYYNTPGWFITVSYTHLNNRMNSFNHYSFGAVGSWMYNYSLGIQRDEAFPGFKHFILSLIHILVSSIIVLFLHMTTITR